MKRRTKKVLLIAAADVCCVSVVLIGMMLKIYGDKYEIHKHVDCGKRNVCKQIISI